MHHSPTLHRDSAAPVSPSSAPHDPTKLAWLVIATLPFAAAFFLPLPEGLTAEGARVLAVFAVAALLWVTSALPLVVTSLLVLVLLPLTGSLTPAATYALFGNEAVFFILGAFILASVLARSGLTSRLSLLMLRRFGSTPSRLRMAVLGLGAGMSFLMNEHAVAAMLFPMVVELTRTLNLKEDSPYGKGLHLALAWGVVIGGIGTFLGGARAPLAVSILKNTTGIEISFVAWMLAALPTVLLMLATAAILLETLFKAELSSVQAARAHLEERVRALGAVSPREKGVAILMNLTILAWMLLGTTLGLATIALAAVVFAFTFKLALWKEIETDVNWGLILMYGGAITLGSALERTGAAQYLTRTLLGGLELPHWLVIVVLGLLALLMTEAVSNTATVAILLPGTLSLAGSLGLDFYTVVLVVALGAGLSFILPLGTPATAIAFGSGFVKSRDTLRAGPLMNAAALLFLLLSTYFIWPLIF